MFNNLEDGNRPEDKLPKKLWFKQKRYGLGWQPFTWEGWLVMVILAMLVLAWTFYFESDLMVINVWTYQIGIFVLVILLIFVVYKKGEKLKWRRGK